MKNIFKIINYEKNLELWKILNYIAVSDSDDSYIRSKNVKFAKILKLLYLILVITIIFISFIPLFSATKDGQNLFPISLSITINYVLFSILIIDYFFRWITFPLRVENKKYSLLFFPFTGVSIVMFFALLPSLIIIISPSITSNANSAFFLAFSQIVNSLVFLRLGRLILFLNVLTPFTSIKNVFVKQRVLLFNVFIFLIIISVLFALIIFQAELVENAKITNFWDAFYFTIVSLTTIGFGDISPVTPLGQAMVVILALIGVAIFTIPAGIIAGGFLQELQNNEAFQKQNEKSKESQKGVLLQKIIAGSAKALINVSKKTSRPIKKNSLLFSKKSRKEDEIINEILSAKKKNKNKERI
ncbi:potassium channel family protein [[Mycoplasma] mobile]|uniref:Putative K+ ion channel membrane protein n=1 Tax=Mycoplasma mobile (strain ATCC 43663 / 163K / NCTC 11711) TaxID=267748 RepID=Q6KIF7_MYCM1|nr:potassium channel family protein [[Mycoplasma] mobile]AAT27619.1 putative K+ ion channel membrane protein [Mycoplasma mobile 163K]